MKNILICWIGLTDIRASKNDESAGLGPIAQAVTARYFDEIVLISNLPSEVNATYSTWLNQLSDASISLHEKTPTGPTKFGEIYEAAVGVVLETRKRHGKDAAPTFHISPGTPAMAAVWMAFIKRNIALGSRIGEIYREDRWEYPLEAVREAIINAVVHRDYAIQVQFIKKEAEVVREDIRATVEVTGQVTQEVLLLLGALHGEMTRSSIQEALGLKGRDNFENRYLKPALADALIELTLPDKPKSSKQKYRLTEKGRSCKGIVNEHAVII